MEEKFNISTLENLPNMEVEEHMGLVSGSSVTKGNGIKNFIHSFKNFFGGEVKELDATFEEARNSALDQMKNEAIKRGANSVINVRFESLRLSNGYCEVHVYGSAVKATSF
ncbi:MAG: hypothetical protein K0R73_697 [Candidatus Midichloriaceae bacterium]|jgi:uncharacterized protein YbjQ (UPF0145 family)|nr:hypothetical protein [Candidatus Midichloriaceae bacterium]